MSDDDDYEEDVGEDEPTVRGIHKKKKKKPKPKKSKKAKKDKEEWVNNGDVRPTLIERLLGRKNNSSETER